MPHLVIIRGNSASGKTTAARSLQLALGRGTANIGQDHFRRVVLREHDVPQRRQHRVDQCDGAPLSRG
ncbi:zeta toxin family protein [Propionibacteriaceae bacterium Y1700]|uniref:zeta toxin family protein n=1 Tax=Microlunatus sp. Y1700 TaxID=3418487 RepID=UPI003DA7782A